MQSSGSSGYQGIILGYLDVAQIMEITTNPACEGEFSLHTYINGRKEGESSNLEKMLVVKEPNAKLHLLGDKAGQVVVEGSIIERINSYFNYAVDTILPLIEQSRLLKKGSLELTKTLSTGYPLYRRVVGMLRGPLNQKHLTDIWNAGINLSLTACTFAALHAGYDPDQKVAKKDGK